MNGREWAQIVFVVNCGWFSSDGCLMDGKNHLGHQKFGERID